MYNKSIYLSFFSIRNMEFQQATENLSKGQEKALDKVLKLQREIENVTKNNEKEIAELLTKNNVNRIDVSNYSRKKQIDTFSKQDFE